MQDLISYIRQQREAGFSDEIIRQHLAEAGWDSETINSAFGGHDPSHSAESQKLKGAFLLLIDALKLFNSRRWTVIGLNLIPLIAIFIAVIAFLGSAKLFEISDFTWPMVVLAGFVILVILLLMLPVMPAIIFNLKEPSNIGIKKSYLSGWKYVIPFIWISALSTFAALGGFVMLIIPGVIITVWLYLSQYALIIDNERGMSALMKSREYARGRWWAMAWRFFWIAILISLINFIFGLISDLAGSISKFLFGIFSALIMPAYYVTLYREAQRTYVPKNNPPKKTFVLVAIIVGLLSIPIFLIGLWFFFQNRFSMGTSFVPFIEKFTSHSLYSSLLNLF